MAEDGAITIEVSKFRTKKQQELLSMLNDNAVRVEINTRIKDAINKFVPLKSGALRESAKANPDSITWGNDAVPYAHYQYEGVVYGPNFVGWTSPATWGWRSPRGKGSKHPTDRELGNPGAAVLRAKFGFQYFPPGKTPTIPVTFGYTTSGTQHHWDKAFTYQVKQQTNLEITRYLKRECKKRGLS